MRTALSGAIPWQYVPYVWESLSQPTSLAFGFKYLRENWDAIYKTYKDKPIILKAVVKNFLYALSSKSDLEDVSIQKILCIHFNDKINFSVCLCIAHHSCIET